MLKLGLAGTWHVHFDGYVKEFLNTGKCEIVSLWDPKEINAKEKGENLNIPYFTSIDEFLKTDIDAVMVCCETSLHPDVYIKIANAKKHIFTEKVLTETPEQAEKVRQAVKENGIKFCISFPWRSRADFIWIKNAVDTGILGDVTCVRMRNAHNGLVAGWLPDTFLNKEDTCGGAMMDLGAHSMYILNWLLGKPQSATSVFTNVMCQTVEDNCVSVLKYESGAIGVNETSFVAQGDPFSLQVTGTKGTALAGWYDDELKVNIGDGWQTPEIGESALSPINLFVNGVIENTEIPYTIDDAYDLTYTMNLAYKNIL